MGSLAPDDAVTDFDPGYPAVQIYRVSGAAAVATVQPGCGHAARGYGGPESLITLADAGLLGGRPVLLEFRLPRPARGRLGGHGHAAPPGAQLRRAAHVLLADADRRQRAQTFEATGDYTEPGWARYLSVAQYHGIANVTASSSASGIGAIPGEWASGLLPYSAVDGDMRTMWESGSWTGPAGQWLQVTFDTPVNPGVIRVALADLAPLGPPVTRVVLSTSAGRAGSTGSGSPTSRSGCGCPRARPAGCGSPWPASPGRRIPWSGPRSASREISVPGVQPSRTILAPAPRGGDPAAVVLAKSQPQPSGCMLTVLRWVCSPWLRTATEEQYGFDQGFTEPGPASGPADRIRRADQPVPDQQVRAAARPGPGHGLLDLHR